MSDFGVRGRIPFGEPRQSAHHKLAFVNWLVVIGSITVGLSSGCGDDTDPSRSKAQSLTHPAWFAEVTESTGLNFTYQTFITDRRPMPSVMGGGLALFDADGDGDLDVYLANGSSETPIGARGTRPAARFFRQESPLRFRDATLESGLGDPGYGQGVAIGDFDNDGAPDLLALNYGPDALYRNRGDGTFEDVTERAGIHIPGWSVSGAFVDIDRDGFLDLYLVQYVEFDPTKSCTDSAGRPEFCGPLAHPPLHDILLRNRCDGTFEDISVSSGIASAVAAGLGVVAQDFNGDGWVDLYVANDAYANQLWINRGDLTFVDESIPQGAAFNMNSQAEAGMGVVSEDFDGDGLPDLFITHLVKETNTLYRNLGGGVGFQDATGASGLGSSSMRHTGFGTSAMDVELDGDIDLVIANGGVNRGAPIAGSNLPDPWPLYAESNLLYRNEGGGRFAIMDDPSFSKRQEVSRGLVTGDLDGDGDLDMIVTNLDSPTRVYRNDAIRHGSWLRIRAIDPALGRDAIGARITIRDGGATRTRTVSQAVGYGSSGPVEAHFGVTQVPTSATVRWPSGESEEFPLPGVDRALTLRRGTGTPER